MFKWSFNCRIGVDDDYLIRAIFSFLFIGDGITGIISWINFMQFLINIIAENFETVILWSF
jgi:hypothetical protein